MATTHIKCELPCQYQLNGFCMCWQARWYWGGDDSNAFFGESDDPSCPWQEEEASVSELQASEKKRLT